MTVAGDLARIQSASPPARAALVGSLVVHLGALGALAAITIPNYLHRYGNAARQNQLVLEVEQAKRRQVKAETKTIKLAATPPDVVITPLSATRPGQTLIKTRPSAAALQRLIADRRAESNPAAGDSSEVANTLVKVPAIHQRAAPVVTPTTPDQQNVRGKSRATKKRSKRKFLVAGKAPLTPPDFSRAQNQLPTYPALAEQRGWSGTVTLRLLVDRRGRVTSVRIHRSSGYDVLDAAAVAAAKHWRAKPAMKNGQPIDQLTLFPVTFAPK